MAALTVRDVSDGFRTMELRRTVAAAPIVKVKERRPAASEPITRSKIKTACSSLKASLPSETRAQGKERDSRSSQTGKGGWKRRASRQVIVVNSAQKA